MASSHKSPQHSGLSGGQEPGDDKEDDAAAAAADSSPASSPPSTTTTPGDPAWPLQEDPRGVSESESMMVARVPSRGELVERYSEAVAGHPLPYRRRARELVEDGDADGSCKGCMRIQRGEQLQQSLSLDGPDDRALVAIEADGDAAGHDHVNDHDDGHDNGPDGGPDEDGDTMHSTCSDEAHPPAEPSVSGSDAQPAPERIHELRHDSSVLALAVSDEYIFAGTHNGEILVWSLGTFQLVQTIQAHKRSVLCLVLHTPTTSSDPPAPGPGGASSNGHPSSSDDANGTDPSASVATTPTGPLLFSSAGDAIISVWCPRTFHRLYEIYSTHDVGDIFSVAYSAQHDTVYMGAQNTTIQWINLGDPRRRALHDSAQHPDRRYHRFFDSKAVGGTSTPRRSEERWNMIPKAQAVLEVDRGAIYHFAHYGYVYCMLTAKGPTVLVDSDEEVLISGSGDGTIKMWRLGRQRHGLDGAGHEEQENNDDDDDEPQIQEIMCLGTDNAESVMSLAIDGSFLYSGKLDGIVELWDLDTKQKLRVIKAHRGDIMALQLRWNCLWSAAATGSVTKHSTVHYRNDSPASSSETVSQKYQCLLRWKAHDGKILASAATTYRNDQLYITGANDDTVSVWRVNDKSSTKEQRADMYEDMMLTTLREFVSYKTVSSRPEFGEDCRKGASFLCNLFKRLGGQVEMLSSDQHHNPVVCARFGGKLEPARDRKRILFYGHYDVVAADTKKASRWLTDPFELKGTNGYLYGRGVSDNKGPIMAALYAVTDLMQSKQLDSDVVFLIEGEEESGSRGFQEAVRQNKDLIGDVDYILLANSYWLDDETPCLTYGLRGVLHATVCVDSPHPDLHSGVDGSYMIAEPLSDLTTLLSTLKGPRNRVMIPGFYDAILPSTPAEEARYDAVTAVLMRRKPDDGPAAAAALKRGLMARWREPNLTIHRYKVSGPDGSLVSSHASANISLRLVPGQEVDDVAAALAAFLGEGFAALESGNSLSVRIDNKAEPWLGDPDNEIFRTLEGAIVKVWGLAGGDSSEGGGGGGGGGGVGSDGSAEEPAAEVNGDGDEAEAEAGPEARAEAEAEARAEAEAPPKAKAKYRKPLYIREGGSIPAIRFLEKEFGAPAAHLPCGQATDSAHLDNERLRVLNLLKSREIFGEVFRRL